MEPGSYLNAILEYGSMGLFAAFLVWQHLSMQKRFDKLVENFQTQIESIRDRASENEDKLRSRYDAVISGLNSERTELRSNLSAQMKDVKRTIGELGKIGETVQSRVDALSVDQQGILDIVKEQAQARKAEVLAKTAAMQAKLTKGE